MISMLSIVWYNSAKIKNFQERFKAKENNKKATGNSK
jgi:hypothetical protein